MFRNASDQTCVPPAGSSHDPVNVRTIRVCYLSLPGSILRLRRPRDHLPDVRRQPMTAVGQAHALAWRSDGA